MIDLKQAADRAMEYFQELFQAQSYIKVLVDEVELSEDEKYWMVTLGYEEKPAGSLGLDMVHRKHKVFRIDVESHRIVSMHNKGD